MLDRILGAIQNQSVERRGIIDKIKELFGKLLDTNEPEQVERILIRDILPEVLRETIPSWCKEAGGLRIGRGTVFNAGTFCVYWGKDPDTGKIMALLHVRKEHEKNGKPKLGAIGGYTVKPEQSFNGVLRESLEEVCGSDGKPVISPDIAKYAFVQEGKDFDRKPPALPVQYTGYAYELDEHVVRALKQYAAKFSDQTFREQVKEKSEGETLGVKFLPLEEIAKMSPNQFMYRRQYDLFREIDRRLKGAKPSSPVGFTIGDSQELFVSRIRHNGRDIKPISPF